MFIFAIATGCALVVTMVGFGLLCVAYDRLVQPVIDRVRR